MAAALEEFASRGYHGTTVPDVAARAGVATGTLYHYFETKEQLVNEVYRDTKLRMRSALLDGLADPIVDRTDSVEAWFLEVWRRLAAFERAEPAAFRFLEMREHFDYLDRESQQLELATVLPVFAVARRVDQQADGARADLVIALSYGAFVGLVKASRLRYVTLDEASVVEAGRIAWKMFAPQAMRALAGGD
jgi:TetR/AcrR family transcriptional regulator, repressor of fatR-cypB operon